MFFQYDYVNINIGDVYMIGDNNFIDDIKIKEETVNKDVYKRQDLLHLTMEMSGKLNKPLVTMSMGQMGVISRICGELTGSAITFASAGKASAPGQIAVEDMNVLLEALHHD